MQQVRTPGLSGELVKSTDNLAGEADDSDVSLHSQHSEASLVVRQRTPRILPGDDLNPFGQMGRGSSQALSTTCAPPMLEVSARQSSPHRPTASGGSGQPG